jgi:hypothetical protein
MALTSNLLRPMVLAAAIVGAASVPALADVSNGNFSAAEGDPNNAADWTENVLAGAGSPAPVTGARRVELGNSGNFFMEVFNGSFSQSLNLAANTVYSVSFLLTGPGKSDSLSSTWFARIVGLAGAQATGSLFWHTNETKSFQFTSGAGGPYTLEFGINGDQYGAFDNVSVTAVPLPVAGAGLPVLAALAIWGYARRRKA